MENRTDDPLAMYMRELSTIVPLTKHEETSLFRELRETIGTNRGEIIQRRLIESQLPLVVNIAQKHAACGIPMLELIQEGNLGLMKSARMFIETPPGEDFPTFAATHIEGAITMAAMRKETMSSYSKPGFPKLPQKLREDIGTITPSVDGDLTYWPCAARLRDGTVLPCVYVVPEGPYNKHWGVYPQHDRGKSYISISDVDALAESPRRLPARFANMLYKSGESGMGYTIFTVIFADGSRQAYGDGNAVDFIRYPEGMGQNDVIEVLPHEGRTGEPVRHPEYYWCLFSE